MIATTTNDDSDRMAEVMPDDFLLTTACVQDLLHGLATSRPVRERLRQLDEAKNVVGHSRLFLALFPGCRSWRQVAEGLNLSSQYAVQQVLNNLHDLYITCGLPVWDYIECAWQHRETGDCFTTTPQAREADAAKFGTNVPGLNATVETHLLDAIA